MLSEFQQFFSENVPDAADKQLLVACSGGVDSMVLVDLLLRSGISPSLAHVNFGLRGEESDGDEQFVKQYALDKNLRFFSKKVNTAKYASDLGYSIQMAAREIRYAWFEELMAAHDFDYLLTAHHLDDALETFMINLSRGSGIKGLLGIPTQRDRVLRPLLGFNKDALIGHATAFSVRWREDSSNSSGAYLRNALRQEVIPAWKAIQPQLLDGFDKSRAHLAGAQRLLEDYMAQLGQRLSRRVDEDLLIDIRALLQTPNYHDVLYYLLSPYGFTAWEDLHNLLEAQSGKWVSAPGFRLVKGRDHLILSPEKSDAEQVHRWEDPSGQFVGPLVLSATRIEKLEPVSDESVILDADKIQFPLVLRRWKEGDRFHPFGMQGSKKLSKFFKDEKLSLVDKERVWLLCSGEQIVWVIGHRMDDTFKVGPQTRNMLRIDLIA
jgi:tRNA(Ile)-lysidine synthase